MLTVRSVRYEVPSWGWWTLWETSGWGVPSGWWVSREIWVRFRTFSNEVVSTTSDTFSITISFNLNSCKYSVKLGFGVFAVFVFLIIFFLFRDRFGFVVFLIVFRIFFLFRMNFVDGSAESIVLGSGVVRLVMCSFRP